MTENLLTPREEEVLDYLTKGLTNKEIAEIMNVTHHTIKAHISAILHKFNCKNRTDAALIAQRKSFVTRLQD
ncbi:response regulator transcription factor [bacterium]|nr:response regulator transcription factor [bacterium]